MQLDEFQHRSNAVQCEVARLSEIMDSVGGLNLHVIRFNPHAAAWRSSPGRQKEALLAALKTALASNFGRLQDSGCCVEYLGYSDNRIKALEDVPC